jgi:hypothetical protein
MFKYAIFSGVHVELQSPYRVHLESIEEGKVHVSIVDDVHRF